jgi:hypothetical protein
MSVIKNHLVDALQKLGYAAKVNGLTNITFGLRHCAEFEGNFEITSANAKRFEVSVAGNKESDLNVPATKTEQRLWVAHKRFNKRADTIEACMEWIATAAKAHAHLYELLHPEAPLPPAVPFVDGKIIFLEDHARPGTIFGSRVLDIVTLAGRLVVHTAYNPQHRPFFLAEVQPRHALSVHIVTDGDVFYPCKSFIIENKTQFRVFPYAKIPPMNQLDREVIHAACQKYVEKILSETP